MGSNEGIRPSLDTFVHITGSQSGIERAKEILMRIMAQKVSYWFYLGVGLTCSELIIHYKLITFNYF